MELKIKLIICILIIHSYQIFPQETNEQTNPVLLTAILKLESVVTNIDESIVRYQKSIDKCDKTIKTSNELIQISKQESNTQAEKVASDALRKSTETKQKNLDLIQKANQRKEQCRGLIAVLKDNAGNVSAKTTAALLRYSGNVTVTKANGKNIKLGESNINQFEDGDIIVTADKSSVEMQFLDGRGHMIIGENSRMKFSKQDSIDVVDMIDGKVKMDVEKVEAFYDNLEKKYEEFKKLAQSPDKAFDLLLAKTRRYMLKKFNKKKFEVRTPSAICGIRGTQFITQYHDKQMELIVLEGSVEMKSVLDEKTILVNGGQRGFCSENGQLLEVRTIDINKEERWWKDE